LHVAPLDVDVIAEAFGRFGGAAAASAAREFWAKGPEAIFGYLEHCMPLYSVGSSDAAEVSRAVMNFELMGHFQAGEQATMDLAPGLVHARCSVLVAGGELDPVCPVEMGDEIAAALTNAGVTYERIPGASHDDVGRRAEAAIRAFISA
jgi:pimeloyl-ACP methyl ester carboxylesterase